MPTTRNALPRSLYCWHCRAVVAMDAEEARFTIALDSTTWPNWLAANIRADLAWVRKLSASVPVAFEMEPLTPLLWGPPMVLPFGCALRCDTCVLLTITLALWPQGLFGMILQPELFHRSL